MSLQSAAELPIITSTALAVVYGYIYVCVDRMIMVKFHVTRAAPGGLCERAELICLGIYRGIGIDELPFRRSNYVKLDKGGSSHS